MKKLIHMDTNLGALHCDNPNCQHVIEARAFTRDLIGYPCPKCGSDMLTERDYNRSMAFMNKINFINRWFGWLGSEKPPKSGEGCTVSVRHTPDGIEVKTKEY